MDVFALRNTIVREYRDYFDSFVNIHDPEIETFVRGELDNGTLWPDAVLQLNPAFEPGATLGELAERGTIRHETARFFGRDLRLHRHQLDALMIAQRRESYVVTTGTGSGKSLTYLLAIVDDVFRRGAEPHAVRALIVYPMNALINSQLTALERYRDRNWPDCPLRFGRYTGQERNEARTAILDDPPHILLTNYVMLEYMLIRPAERDLVKHSTRDLRFLVMDEMHVYRGRQGADVAMLLRRVRQRSGADDLLCVGTSATLATEGSRAERQARIAAVGSTLFGVDVPPANVVGETLRRMTAVPVPRMPDELRRAVEMPPPAATLDAVTTHPLAAWLEDTFGLTEDEGVLVRRSPITFDAGVAQLAEVTGVDTDACRERLAATLAAGNAVRATSGEPVFAFRLHQFLASGSSVFATAEPTGPRTLTVEGQYQAQPTPEGMERLLYPLAFCRECGQEHYLVSRHLDNQTGLTYLLPRSPVLNAPDDDTQGTAEYFSPQRDDLWADDEDLPEHWFEQRKGGPKLKKTYEQHKPVHCWVRPDGVLHTAPMEGATEGWLQPRPLMLCPRCRATHDGRESEFGKLATLSQTGRSTATTILTSTGVVAMRGIAGLDPASRKMLSFTDNRQDASLQAGHLNDYVLVALLRGALVRALAEGGDLTFEHIGPAMFDALELEPEQFMREAVASGPALGRARKSMTDLLQYRAFEDLRRAWRVAQPNLEQCGLLHIGYEGLDEIAADDATWRGVIAMGDADVNRRVAVLRAVLDHLRSNLAIDAKCLKHDETEQLKQRVNQSLREPWTVDDYERLRVAAIALLPGVEAERKERIPTVGLGWRSAIGRFLRSKHTWGVEANLDMTATEELVRAIVAALRGHLLTLHQRKGEDYGVQIKADALLWLPGDGRAAPPDPVRTRDLHYRDASHLRVAPNRYFARLYGERAAQLAGVTGREHTGAVSVDDRIRREQEFREGKLAALFCSPTMELGVDIADLSVVHMRNVPPTPANYAQRSGRAGRGGRPALVLTFASQGSAHDQYFFRRKERMIAGSVIPARMDLTNRDLVEAHLHSVWLSVVGMRLGNSLAETLDLAQSAYPVHADRAAEMHLSPARRSEVAEAFRRVVGASSAIAHAPWFTPEWIAETVARAPERFDRAMERWRDLYRAATEQRDAARRVIDLPNRAAKERDEATQREREAKREIDLLLNQGQSGTETDFYPYRYLANEGFLPGYNFPRLPLRALVSVRDDAHTVDRPRFLGLSEFGPWNVIYHEGRKHRVESCILPAGGIEPRLTHARICNTCGYIHPGGAASVDLCAHCGTSLNGTNSEYPHGLLDQPTVRTRRRDRISSDEEERSREGYAIRTHYRFSPTERERRAVVASTEGEPLLEMRYAPQAELWRINNGWRRASRSDGFTIDAESGKWQRREDDDHDTSPDPAAGEPKSGIRPYVTDSRNILLLRPIADATDPDAFLKTLAYALQRGIQFVYQVEEQEIAVELIGEDAHMRLLLWEAAEGGVGVWERILSEPDAVAKIAREALRVCHFDGETGEEDAEWRDRCAVACYDCLLSYSNQREHRHLNRHLVRDYLLALAQGIAQPGVGERDYEEQYQRLRDRIDPSSSLEREFLDYLHRGDLRLPDHAQYRPAEDVPVQADFYYERGGQPGVVVFVDGPQHDSVAQREHDRAVRERLEDRGYKVMVVRHDRTFAEQWVEPSP